MPVPPNPAKAKCLEALKAHGKMPSWKECQDFGKRFKADPSTVFKWAKKLYPDAPAPAAANDSSAPEKPAQAAPAPASQGQAPELAPSFQPLAPEAIPSFGGTPPAAPSAPGSPATLAQPTPVVLTAQEIKPFIDLLDSLFTKGVNDIISHDPTREPEPPSPPTPLTDAEKRQMAEAIAPVAMKYLPLMAQYGAEITCVMVVGGIVVPKVLQARAYSVYVQGQREQRDSRPQAPASPGPTTAKVEQAPAIGADDADARANALRKKLGAL